MKKTICISLLLLVLAGSAFAQQFLVTGQWSMQGSSENIINAAKAGQVTHLGGIGTELTFRHLGFGSTALVGFQKIAVDSWKIDWDLRAYMSYHFFRPGSFLDPFIQAGGGAYGDVQVQGNGCLEESWTSDQVNVAFYPHLGAGLGLKFRGGLYVSGQFNWRPGIASVPCCETIGTPEYREYEMVVSLGYAFGRRR